jgi:hypothetical protein
MPKLADAILAQHYDSVIKLAAKTGGVSRMELMSNLGVSRIVADKLIDKTKLVPGPKVGRTEFFVAATSAVAGTPVTAPALPEGAQAAVLVDDSKKAPLPPPVAAEPEPKVAAISEPEATKAPDVKVEMDEQIVKVKEMISADCAALAKAQEKLAVHQAMLTSMLVRRFGI